MTIALIFMGGGIAAGLLLIALLRAEQKRRPRFYEWIGGGFAALSSAHSPGHCGTSYISVVMAEAPK